MKAVKQTLMLMMLAILVSLNTLTGSASAHVLESDNGVSAILHIKPDDRPLAGKPVPVNFLFSNDVGGFSLDHYNVQLRLVENNSVKFKSAVKPLFFGASTEGETIATFPEAGLYDLIAEGTPKTSDVPPFKLVFDVRVASKTVKRGPGSTTAVLSGVSLLGLGMVATQRIRTGRKYR